MKHLWLPLFVAFAALAQRPGIPQDATVPPSPPSSPGLRRQQKDAISKQDYQDNARDAAELVKLSQGLEASLERNGSFVVDANDIRTADQIEKLAKNIRGRLKRF
ncbi:MAG TPA: hypothetical protein VGR73_21210 [Bryobacteraceae bacterium]|nr:hypothetical protein [Bryobacteraceae bacterium]